MKRRHFILSTLMTTLGLSAKGAASPATASAVSFGEDLTVSSARAIRKNLPGLEVLRDQISDENKATYWNGSDFDAEKLLNLSKSELRNRVSSDFAEARTIEADGWVLSEHEVLRIVALAKSV